MTSREIVKANIECRCEGRIGFDYGNAPGRMEDFAEVECWRIKPPEKWVEGNIEYSTDIWGNTWHRVKDMAHSGEIARPVLADWKDLESLELPDIANAKHYDKARALGEADGDLFRVGGLPGFPFDISRYMRRMEVYFVDLIAERERIDILHERVTSLLESVIDRYGEAGLDAVMFCEDLGTQDRLLMSPAMWRDIFAPLYERLTGRAHKYGMKVIQHSCGYNWELIDDLCGSGIDCLQFDQPGVYDMPALAGKLRKHGVGLYSPVDIQKVLPTGDREAIERAARYLVDTFRGGFIATNYGDLAGIGVDPEWDGWAYEAFVRAGAGPVKG